MVSEVINKGNCPPVAASSSWGFSGEDKMAECPGRFGAKEGGAVMTS